MSDRNDMMLSDDLERITLYLNGRLSDDERAEVERRLESDKAFHELVEPMLFAWAINDESDRKPVASDELEELWDEFTRRAGFVHQKKRAKTRRLWIIGIVLAAIAIGGFLSRERIQSAYRDWRDYAPVGADTGWVPLRDHIQVRVEPGARARAAIELRNNAQFLRIGAGTAHFRVQLTDTTRINPATTPVVIETRAGNVFSGYGDFTVTVRGDTTEVEDHPPQRPRYIGFMPFPSMTMVRAGTFDEPVRVTSAERIRLIRGQPLQRMP